MKHRHSRHLLMLIFLSLTLFLTLLSGCGRTKEKPDTKTSPENSITPAMWKVTDPDGHQIYMMGSIHMADETAEVFPDYFEKVYQNCDALAVECDISDIGTGFMSIYRKMMYTDGSTIRDHVKKESYDTVAAVFKEADMYSVSYEYMKPVIWVTLLETIAAGQAGLSEQYGIDSMLINRAKNEGKEILEVESVDFQMDLLFNLSDEVQSLLFDEVAQENILEEYVNSLTELYDNWKKGTLTEEILNGSGEPAQDTVLTAEEQTLLEEYDRAMIADRNIGMKNAALSYMKDGKNVLFVVGAAHFYGEEGILALLEEAGCTVELVSPAAPEKQQAAA